MKSLSIRNASRLVSATGSILSLAVLTGLAFTPQAQARQSSGQAIVSLTSVSAPTQFTSGQSIPVEIRLSGASAPVRITSLPAGIVNYTGTAADGVTLSVPTTAVNTNGSYVAVTLVVTSGSQSISTTSETRGELEPIFPKATTAATPGELEPIFPKPSSVAIMGELEPIFPKPSEAATKGELEPIFPKPSSVAIMGELEPIFPKPSEAVTKGELEPIFPRATIAARFRHAAPPFATRHR